MKKSLIAVFAVAVLGVVAVAAATATAKSADALPAPDKTGGKPLMQCLTERKSSRNFDAARELDMQTISNLLYAAWGVNRPGESKHTAPTARNVQDVIVMIALPQGVFRFEPDAHALTQVSTDDVRAKLGSNARMLGSAGAVVVLISDFSRLGQESLSVSAGAAFHAGSVSQNISLYCASADLGSVVVGSFNESAIRELFALPDAWRVQIIQPVGYTTD